MRSTRLFRWQDAQGQARLGLIAPDGRARDLTAAGVGGLTGLLERPDLVSCLRQLARTVRPAVGLPKKGWLAPVELQEVWAAGVTYQRSRTARMAESSFSGSAYDRVYAAPRPELFFKALAGKVVGSGEAVGIRADARWSVPEPELALVLNSRGRLVGYTIGNDMSSRDIEGENLLYLPQAKVYRRSCALGPWIVVGATEAEARTWKIELRILRRGRLAFAGETPVHRLRRTFAELTDYLFRSQEFPHGVVLLSGTGIVPPDSFTLRPEDQVRIRISGIGLLANPVIAV